MTSALTLISVAWGTALAQLPPYYLPQTIGAERACRSDAFTLETAFWTGAFPASFEATMEAAVVPQPRWFEPTSPGDFRTVLTSVLHDRSVGAAVPAMRRDGHRRSYLVSFEHRDEGRPEWKPARTRPEQSCAIVKTLRATAAAMLGLAPFSCAPDGNGRCTRQPPVLVARSCGASVQDVEATLPSSTVSWANTRIGAAVPPPGTPAPVDVALIDTGVDPTWQSTLGVVVERELPPFETGLPSPVHPHGAHMAALIRSVAPTANLWSYRALDRNGQGSLSSVARSVDFALFDNGRAFSRTAPLVVNLSVGAPPEFAKPAALTGVDSCETWEDGAGETLRYVLAVAGEMDAAGPAVFIAASSGNSVLERAATTAKLSENRGTAQTPCAGLDAAPAQSSFLPAAFGEQASCRGVVRWAPVLPVGATTYGDALSTVTLRGSMPFLMAPGERVFANHPALPRAPSALECGSSFVSRGRGLEMPASVTGTSASSALVAGAAARLLGSFPAGPVPSGWRASTMARLLYLSGQPLCTKGVAQPQRRLDVSRAEEMMKRSSTACSNLRACVGSASRGRLVDGLTASDCGSLPESCVLPTFQGCPSSLRESSWKAPYSPWVFGGASSCRLAWGAATGPRILAPMRLWSSVSDVHLGQLGPQPGGSGCPTCQLLVTSSVEVVFELSDAFDPSAQFADAFLVIFDRDKLPLTFLKVSDGRDWWPGQVGSLRVEGGEPYAEGLLSGDYTAAFDLGVVTRDSEERVVRLVSPLAVVKP